MTLTVLKVPIPFLLLEDGGVPQFLTLLCQFIEENSSEVGIFRENGSSSFQQTLNQALAGCPPTLPAATSVHDAACFLKCWLRELPTPLVDPMLVNKYLRTDDPRWPISVVKNLKEPNRKALAVIFRTLKEVVNKADINRMTFQNLSICFVMSFTQNNRGLDYPFPFESFYRCLTTLLTDDKTDFIDRAPLLIPRKPKHNLSTQNFIDPLTPPRLAIRRRASDATHGRFRTFHNNSLPIGEKVTPCA